MRVGERRATPAVGHNDGLTQALTFVVAPLLLGLIGYGLDRWLGTRPVLMLALACFGVAGTFVTSFYEYQARCAREDEGKPWTRRRA
ncbi:MAG TPA: AtpZ/AtpI family protein [Acidimicrobiia bacterium]|nr:AtpZ/AtpI family protein [Acidimicrobiia bacterium]